MNIKAYLKALKNKKYFALLLCLAAFICIAEDIWQNEKITADTYIYNSLTHIISEQYTAFFTFMTRLADIYFLAALCILIFIFIKNKRYSFIIIINLISTIFLNQILKAIFMRSRPNFLILIDADGYSFPSGHAMVAASFYGLLIYLLNQMKIRKKYKVAATIFLCILIGLIGLSRIYLRAHYTSDVIAGFLISVAYLIAYTSFISGYLKRKKSIS
jgi:undecaprenyl-diphosphatase